MTSKRSGFPVNAPRLTRYFNDADFNITLIGLKFFEELAETCKISWSISKIQFIVNFFLKLTLKEGEFTVNAPRSTRYFNDADFIITLIRLKFFEELAETCKISWSISKIQFMVNFF